MWRIILQALVVLQDELSTSTLLLAYLAAYLRTFITKIGI